MASKYQGKKQGNGKSAKPVVVRDERAPVFLYTSECCGELAKKTACLVDYSVKFEERKAALGHWRCSKCRKACIVTRKLNKDGIIPFRPTVRQAITELVSGMGIGEAVQTLIAIGA